MAMIAAGVTPEDSPQRVSFYFAPHEDDWQLFMNPSAFHDVLESSTKGVFIHVTAGDAGLWNKQWRPTASALSRPRKRR